MNQNTGKTHCKRGHEFSLENTYHKGSRRVCRVCTRAAAVYREADIRRRIKDHKDPIRRKNLRNRRRKSQLKQIGWTPELYENTLKEQKKKCAVCKRKLSFEEKKSAQTACADHKHSNPPIPRGIICSNCNFGIGSLQDNPVLLRAAADYLERYGG